jgi:hypothetical protein
VAAAAFRDRKPTCSTGFVKSGRESYRQRIGSQKPPLSKVANHRYKLFVLNTFLNGNSGNSYKATIGGCVFHAQMQLVGCSRSGGLRF